MRQQRQLAQQPADVVAAAEEMNPPGQRSRRRAAQVALELPRFGLLRVALADDEIMDVRQLIGDLRRGAEQHVLPLAQADLPDGPDQLRVGGSPSSR